MKKTAKKQDFRKKISHICIASAQVHARVRNIIRSKNDLRNYRFTDLRIDLGNNILLGTNDSVLRHPELDSGSP